MASWSNTVSKRLLPGRKGTVTTLRAMTRLARAGSGNPAVVKVAQDAVRSVPERDHDGEIAAMLSFVRSHMRYTRDPLDTETIKAADVMVQEILEHGQFVGDCDDASVLLAAMLGAIGYATDFKIAGADPGRPREPSHVWVGVRHPRKGWIALDPIVRQFDVGDEMPPEHVVGSRGRVRATEGDSQMYGLGATDENSVTGWFDRLSPFAEQVVRSRYPVKMSGSEKVEILKQKVALAQAQNQGMAAGGGMSDTMKIGLVVVGAAVIFMLMKKR